MSVLDEIMCEGGSELLIDACGDETAALIWPLGAQGDPLPVAGIVGTLRVEERQERDGQRINTVHYEICQLSVNTAIYRCDQLGIRTRVVIGRYTRGDASTQDQEAFTVRTIDSISLSLVTVTLERKQLASVNRRN